MFSREIVSLQFKKTSRASRYYSGSNEPSLAPQFKWPDNLKMVFLETMCSQYLVPYSVAPCVACSLGNIVILTCGAVWQSDPTSQHVANLGGHQHLLVVPRPAPHQPALCIRYL
jgi:hypothetical protein